MANPSSSQIFSIMLIVSFFSSSPWTSWHTSYWSKTIGCWRLICWLTLFLTWSKLLSSSLAVTSSSGIFPSTTFCLDCTASRQKNAAICCGMRNSSILNRRAPLSSRALRMSLATFSGSCLLPVQQAKIYVRITSTDSC